jgi:hypothetical protein
MFHTRTSQAVFIFPRPFTGMKGLQVISITEQTKAHVQTRIREAWNRHLLDGGEV